MADERQPPPDQPRESAGRPGGTGADETREMPAAGADETRALPPVGPDETREMARGGGSEGTPAASRWSGRAGVPPPDAFVVREAVPVEEDAVAGRRPWLPMLLVLVVLALLALLGVALWMILRGNDDPAPGTPVTPAFTASATSAEPSPSTPPTPSAPATTASAPPAPTQVVVPRLTGIDSATAQSILDRLGLRSRLSSRPDPVARPGTVLETDPVGGTSVPEGTQVTLVIAVAAPSPAPPSPAPGSLGPPLPSLT